MTNSRLTVLGSNFSNYDDLATEIQKFEADNFINLYIRSSRTVEAGRRRAPKRTFSDDLKFSEVDYACKFGGRAKVSKSTGARPNQSTYLIDCPFKVSLRASKDGQNLTVTSVNDEHNHERDKTAYQHLPKQRRLDEQTATEAATLVSMKSNKKLLQSHLTKTSGKTVLLEDIHNLRRKQKESCLEDLVSEMKKYEGWSKKRSHLKIATKKRVAALRRCSARTDGGQPDSNLQLSASEERVAALKDSPCIVGIRGGGDTDEEDPEPGSSAGVGEGSPSSASRAPPRAAPPPPLARFLTAEDKQSQICKTLENINNNLITINQSLLQINETLRQRKQ